MLFVYSICLLRSRFIVSFITNKIKIPDPTAKNATSWNRNTESKQIRKMLTTEPGPTIFQQLFLSSGSTNCVKYEEER